VIAFLDYLDRVVRRVVEQSFKLVSVRNEIETKKLGTEYGGWEIVPALLAPGQCVVSAGAGEDISFDVELSRRYQANVHILDPTPRAIAHYQSTRELIDRGDPAPINNVDGTSYNASSEDLQRIEFHSFGLWRKDEKLRFYTPKEPSHVSHSIHNLQSTSGYFEGDCVALESFRRRRHLSRIDVLKMDIEGAEFPVIRSMMRRPDLRPAQLLVEFHPGHSHVEQTVKLKTLFHSFLLWFMGYRLLKKDEWDFVFVHSRALRAFR
jgi:FkbM family methyltransferase